MTSEFTSTLLAAGIDEASAARFAEYADKVVDENTRQNLTRILDPADMAVKHFIDSVAPASLIPENAKVIDIGTGAGFPGAPLKLLRDDIDITLMDSTGKKTAFVERALREMGVSAAVLNARAEETPELYGKFDICVSRAVARLPMLLELCAAFVKVGGMLLMYKGAEADAEIAEAKNAAKKLGLAPAEIHSSELIGNTHFVIAYKKIKETPKGYPRRFAKIKSSPL